jgi:hypothetical protein
MKTEDKVASLHRLIDQMNATKDKENEMRCSSYESSVIIKKASEKILELIDEKMAGDQPA